MIELTLVAKMKVSSKDFKKFMKGEGDVRFNKIVEWDDYAVVADEDNFNGVVLNLGGGEMLFVSNDHEWVRRLLKRDETPRVHIHFPELDG